MSKPKIAVVNNDTTFLHLMHDLLGEEGYQTKVILASDKAYEIVRKEKPDLVILDIVLDDKAAGWTVLDLLRLDPETANIPVIISSTDGNFLKSKQVVLRSKHCETLEKPFLLEELLNKVKVALAG
jgi:DNA-binding response OmpR family regulator